MPNPAPSAWKAALLYTARCPHRPQTVVVGASAHGRGTRRSAARTRRMRRHPAHAQSPREAGRCQPLLGVGTTVLMAGPCSASSAASTSPLVLQCDACARQAGLAHQWLTVPCSVATNGSPAAARAAITNERRTPGPGRLGWEERVSKPAFPHYCTSRQQRPADPTEKHLRGRGLQARCASFNSRG